MTADILSEAGIRSYLKTEGISLKVFPSISSTNTVLKNLAEEGAPEGLCLIAEKQTAGRGRKGRSFYSPPDSGLYMSVLLRPTMPVSETTVITAWTAVAVAEAIESLAPVKAEIKWVNDIVINGKKVCGILTEASVDAESGLAHYLVVGIGVNTKVPESDFPEELKGIAGAAFGGAEIPDLRCRLAAGILDRLMEAYEKPDEKRCFEEYRMRSLVLGKPIRILCPDREPEEAVALELDRDFGLLVQTENGERRKLNSGEVSIRM